MAREDKILAIDIGATSIKLCEFDFTGGASTVSLSRFAYREYEEELSESTRMGVVAGLLRQMLAEGGFTATKALVCMSGQSSLIRFNRLLVMNYDRKKIKQVAEFEATQNIPFQLSEVLWDYQLISNSSEDSIDLMSVVIKNDIVDQFTTAISQVGCVPMLIDVAAAACYNTARACGVGEDGESAILLNIGGRVTNLIFVEGERFYARTIPIAGYTITQQIAKEFGIGLPEAEELKRHHGFVALGGAYAEPESETAANVSKIVRNVMSRLLSEVTRTINAYCSQQKGTRPTKMYITGGSSILTYCDTFFQEKLNIPVEYFNPFKCVNLLPTVDKQRLVEVGHMFSEAIGLGLRYASQCPIELSLIPANIRRQQNFDKKKPFFVMSMLAVVLTLGFVWFGINTRTSHYDEHNKFLKKLWNEKVQRYITTIESAMGSTSSSESEAEQIGELLLRQAKLPAILNEIYRIKPDNLWITSIHPIEGEVKPFEVKSNVEAAENAAAGDMFGGAPGADMFAAEGPGGGGDPFGGGGGDASGTVVTIGGFTISGTCVMPDKRGVTFRLGKETTFPFPVEKSVPGAEGESAEEGESGEEGEENAKPASKTTLNDLMAKEMKSKTVKTPEEAFIAALRMSLLFDADETMTTITYYSISDEFENYSNFRMQVKLAIPVEYLKVAAKAGGGDMMGPGGPEMMP
ncbi:MAG: pilus assembly protein PilM [Victivallales bacterium]|nr:pilus assembly protein PilM [Victivallales bacterium]